MECMIDAPELISDSFFAASDAWVMHDHASHMVNHIYMIYTQNSCKNCYLYRKTAIIMQFGPFVRPLRVDVAVETSHPI
eukprot:290810-Amphidinium_carterae.1